MNGGYIMWDDKILQDLSSNLLSQKSEFAINGLYSRLKELHDTGKVVHGSTSVNQITATFTFNIVSFGTGSPINTVFIAGNLIAYANVTTNDKCYAKYVIIGG